MTKNISDHASRGGKARAKALTKEQRSEIARHAVEARWVKEGKEPLPKATHAGIIRIADREIDCAVLEDHRRVISQKGFARALGAKNPTALDRRGDGKLPAFLGAMSLKPFISMDLAETAKPIPYIHKKGGRMAYGIRADLLPQICEVWLKARDAKKLRHNQIHLAEAADMLIRGLAHVGIIALVDEATGYQADRARDALAKVLEAFVANELRKWIKTFPAEFYKEMFRLRGLPYDGTCKRPQYIGHLTNDLIYSRLAPGILSEFRHKNPIGHRGRRKATHHQWLTEDLGHPKLLQHLSAVIAIMRGHDTWDSFYAMIERALPKYTPMPLWEDQGLPLD